MAATGDKYAVQRLGSITTLTLGLGAAAVVLWCVMLVRRPRRIVRIRSYLCLALLEPTIAYGGLDLGLRHTTAATASLLDGLQSAMVFLMGWLFLRERPRAKGLVGVAVAALGALFLTGSGTSMSHWSGNGLVLLGTLGASASVLVVNRLAPDADALELTAWQFGLGFLLCLPLQAVVYCSGAESPSRLGLTWSVGVAVVIGIVAYALAYVSYNYATGLMSVNAAGMALNFIPIFGVAAAVGILGERVTMFELAGGALVLGGAVLFALTEAESTGHTEITAVGATGGALRGDIEEDI